MVCYIGVINLLSMVGMGVFQAYLRLCLLLLLWIN